MSKNYVKAVLDHLPSVTSPIDALVLLSIAEYTSDETRLAWPSVRALIRRTRLDRRTIQKTLRRLERLRLVSTAIGGHVDNINMASCYRLDFDHRGELLHVKTPPKRGLQRVQTPEPHSTPQSQTVTPPAYVPSPRVKKIATDEPSRDLSGEKKRQLAAILQRIKP